MYKTPQCSGAPPQTSSEELVSVSSHELSSCLMWLIHHTLKYANYPSSYYPKIALGLLKCSVQKDSQYIEICHWALYHFCYCLWKNFQLRSQADSIKRDLRHTMHRRGWPVDHPKVRRNTSWLLAEHHRAKRDCRKSHGLLVLFQNGISPCHRVLKGL